MNRRATLAATSGLLALGIVAGTMTAAAAYPIRDFSPPCPGESALVSIDLLSARYARYLSWEDLQASDTNGNGSLCAIRLQAGPAHTPIDVPISYVDDSGR